MSMLSRLQQQAQGFQEFAERGQEAIDNFDRDKLIADGTASAYKLGREQLGALIGSEALRGLETSAPVLYRTGRALYQRARARPTDTTRRPEQPVGEDENLPQGRAEPPPAPSYEEALRSAGVQDTDIGSQARLAAQRIRRFGGAGPDGEPRSFRYNPEEGTITTQTGEPVEFGEERSFRTPLEQELLDDPRLPSGPVGTVPEREEFEDIDLSTRGANIRANQRFRQAQREIEQQTQQQEPPRGERPTVAEDIPEGIRSRGAYGSQQQPVSQVSDAQRYQLPSLDELRARSEPQAVETQTPQVVQDTRFRPSANSLERENRSIESINEKYKYVDDKLPIGSNQRFVRREEPEPLELEDPGTVRLNLPTALGRTLPTPTPAPRPPVAAPRPPVAAPRQPVAAPRPQPAQAEQEPYITQPPESELDRGLRRLQQFEEEERQAEPTARITQPTPAQQRQLAGERDPEIETPSKPPPPSYDDDEAEDIAKGVAKTESTLAPEEEVSEAIPGVGEILGGLIGLGGAIAGAVEGAEQAKESAPKAPVALPAPELAFSSAPVIDSSDYHNL